MSDAPGFKSKPNKNGRRYYWVAPADAVKAGYRPKTVRLRDLDPEAMAARCRELQAQLNAWKADGGAFPGRGGDTVADLCRQYETDPDSPFAGFKYNSQRAVAHTLGVIVRAVGKLKIRHLTGKDFRAWHRAAGEPATPGGKSRPTRARHVIMVVRKVIAFGVSIGREDCARAHIMLKAITFPTVSEREQRLTRPQAVKLIEVANTKGLHSVALAVAMMFSLGLRMRDVIGEWWPALDAESGILRAGRRWGTGVVWSDIDANNVLTKVTSKRGKVVAHPLNLHPLVLAELARIPPERRVGPLVISERTGQPWTYSRFAATWRKLADEAGIPRDVQARDARSGAVSEGYEAGATTEDMMKFATHSLAKTSAIYNRGSLVQTTRVAKLRLSKTKGE